MVGENDASGNGDYLKMTQKISKSRKEIMGVAILLIMFCHSTLHIEVPVVSQAYRLARQFSKIGVDLFFLLSGMGLYISFDKDNNVLRFYKKRLIRIVPQYAIVFICWGIISISLSLESTLGYIWEYSLISFYISGELVTWFVAAILLLYLLFPLFYKLFQNGAIYVFGMCALIYGVSFCLTLFFMEGTPLRLINEAFIVRIPTFLMGMMIGKNLNTECEKRRNIYIYIIANIACILLWIINARINSFCSRWIERVLFMPTAISMAVVLGCLLEQGGKRIKKAFAFLGSITLEIYLIHEKILLVYDTYIPKCTVGSFLSNASAVIIAVLLSKLLSDAAGKLKKRRYRAS